MTVDDTTHVGDDTQHQTSHQPPPRDSIDFEAMRRHRETRPRSAFRVDPWRIDAPRHLISYLDQSEAVWNIYDRSLIPEDVLERDREIEYALVWGWHAHASGAPSLRVRLPAPIRAHHVLKYSRWLEFDDNRQQQWIESYAQYQERILELLEDHVPEMSRLARELAHDQTSAPLEEYAEKYKHLFDDVMSRYLRKARDLEIEFIVDAINIAQEPDAAREIVPYIEADRLRVRYGFSLRSSPPSADVDLLDFLILLGVDIYGNSELRRLAWSYASEIGPLLESRYHLGPRASQRTHQVRIRHAENPPQDKLSAIRDLRLARQPYFQTYRRLQSINREYLELFSLVLDENTFERLNELVRAWSFPQLYPTPIDSRYSDVRAVLDREDLTGEQKTIVNAYLTEFAQWYESHRRKYERIVRDYRLKFYETLTLDYLEPIVYDARLASFQHELEDRFRRLEEGITEYLESTLPDDE